MGALPGVDRISELRLNSGTFCRYARMSPERFDHLLSCVGPLLQKKHCNAREPVGAAERLMLTIRYLASGESQQSLSFAFRIGRSTVCKIIGQTCNAIWQSLQEVYVSHPKNTDEWVDLAKEFENEWNFPNCLGALDGKHVMIECPHNAGSTTFNYKNFHSLVLMAVCDARYCFTFVDIGSVGSENDSAIFANSKFGKAFNSLPTKLGIPEASDHAGIDLPYVLIGDDIFPLKPWLLKPYPGKKLEESQRIYNYRLSRERRTIENSFGIMSAKWRIFRRPIKGGVKLVDNIIRACICLHNYLRLTENASYVPEGFVDSEDDSGNLILGTWRSIVKDDNSGLANYERLGGNRYTFEAEKARENFKQFFMSPTGAVPWQLNYVRSCGLIHE